MTSRYGPAEPLHQGHLLEGFDCGQDAQSEWLRDHALQAHRSGTSRVYVVRRRHDDLVVGYHALAAGAADQIGVRALLIHCEDDAARRFYLRQAAFEESPTDPMHLMLLMKDLRHALA